MNNRWYISIPTYKRLNCLNKLLESINTQNIGNINDDIVVNVVDNDKDGSAKLVVEKIKPRFKFPLHYYIEENRGVVFVRNKLIKLATNGKGIIFIDDDEVAHRDWLETLITMQAQFSADAVIGRVIYVYNTHVSDWVTNNKFTRWTNFENGQQIFDGNTGNALIATEAFYLIPELFDKMFTNIGSEDKHFFKKLCLRGGKIIYSANAIVYEVRDKERTKLVWWLTRQFRLGANNSVINQNLSLYRSPKIINTLKGFANVFLGLFSLLVFHKLSKTWIVNCLLRISSGIGYWYGTFCGSVKTYGK